MVNKRKPNWDEIVVLSRPGEEFMWREKTPEEKLLSRLPKSSHKGAHLFASAVRKFNGFK